VDHLGNGDTRRRASRNRVVGVLRDHGPLSRAEIVKRASLSRATVSSVIAELKEAGLVLEDAADSTGTQGRTPALVRLHSRAGVAVGIDFGKRHLRVAVADLGHQILAERAVELADDHSAGDGIASAAVLVREVLAEAGLAGDAIVGVGMGLPGPVDQETGELGATTILPGWRGVRAADAMAESLEMPVRVDNDANLGVLAEWTWGAASGARNAAYLKVATGIGAGLIVDGRPFRGAMGMAGEIGHIVIDPNGPLCRCGNRGCLETLAAAPAVLDALRPALGEDVALRDVLALAATGDTGSTRVLHDAGVTIGAAVGALCNLVNPECIVVGGDMAAAGEPLLEGIRRGLSRSAIRPAAQAQILVGVLGERAEVLGAAALALRDSGLGFGAKTVTNVKREGRRSIRVGTAASPGPRRDAG
jgi:predicted NBD/HSP70 family sugar kinase